jgi:hypothetical protein
MGDHLSHKWVTPSGQSNENAPDIRPQDVKRGNPKEKRGKLGTAPDSAALDGNPAMPVSKNTKGTGLVTPGK